MARHAHKLSVAGPLWQALHDKDSQEYILAEDFMLRRLALSGLVPSDIDAKPVTYQGFQGVPAFVIPYASGHWRVRLDVTEGKYRSPPKPIDGSYSHIRAYYPRGLMPRAYRMQKTKYICEGELKAAAMHKRLGVPAIAIGGCYMFAKPGPSGKVLIADIQEVLRPGDDVYYIADRDVLDPSKLGIAQAAILLKDMVERVGCSCTVLVPPEGNKGVDDWLMAGGDNLEDFSEFDSTSIFSVDMLRAKGVQIRPNKDGLYLLANAYNDQNNSMVVTNLVLNGGNHIAFDKYTGLQFDGEPMSFNTATTFLMAAINKLLPGFKLLESSVQKTLEQHAIKLSKTSNKVMEYIKTLEWDGIPRMETWLPQVVGLGRKTDPEYAAKAGSMLIGAMMARIMQPGCQQDYMFVMVGPQGIGKTTFFRTLGDFPVHRGYTTTNNIELSKDVSTTFALKLRSAVILDCDDVESLGRGAQGHLKQFLSKTHDTWRELYSSYMIDEPRGFVMVGSSNTAALLSDNTGARRYIVLDIADIKGVEGPYKWSTAIRDQLLAEAWSKWDTLKETWWTPLDSVDINKAAGEFRWQDGISSTIVEMMDNDKLPTCGKHGTVVSATAISNWLDSNNRENSPDAIGRKLAGLVGSPVCPFTVGERVMITTSKLLEGMADDMKRLYMPRNKVERLWVYPIKPR